jgi:starch synthase
VAECYTADDLDGKAACKKALQKEFGLADTELPVIGIISRLADQKGFDLLAGTAEAILDMGCQLVVLGTGDKKYQEYFTGLKQKFPAGVGVMIGFDNALSHRIEAGADMFLMPSRYEPCGLNQMYSLKYGTIPIVRAVGGLDDTVEDYDPRTGRGNGFKFREYTPAALLDAVQRSVELYKNRQAWGKLVLRAMACDFSWGASARKYAALYERIRNKNENI